MNEFETNSSDALESSKLQAVANCPICHGDSKILLQMSTINPRSKDKVTLRECGLCKHWWHDPLPEQKYLSSLYEANSEFVVSLNAVATLAKPDYRPIVKFAAPILDDFKNYPSFNYLEIGSASGHLVDFFAIFAAKSYGVEPQKVGERANLVPDIDQLPADIKFDCIVMQDVLEHISDPVDMLKKIKSVSNPGAIIYAGFPNKDSFKARLMKDKWSMVRPVGHLNYFSSKSIDKAFQLAGWKIIAKRPARLGDMNAWEILKWFNYRPLATLPYRFFKSLILGQLILGKDQWKVKASA